MAGRIQDASPRSLIRSKHARSLIWSLSLWRALAIVLHPFRGVVALYSWGSLGVRLLSRTLLGLAGWLNVLVAIPPWVRRWLPWRALRRYHIVLAGYTMGWSALSIARHVASQRGPAAARRRQLLQEAEAAETYEVWDAAMSSLEREGLSARGPSPDHMYDRRLLEERTAYLASVRAAGDLPASALAIRSDLLRNLGNLASPDLHETCRAVPEPIRAYSAEVQRHVRAIAEAPDIPLEERVAFLRETRHAFGRTALVLSGGGSFGAFHMGVVRALLDAKLLPRVLAGSSAGAVACAIVATRTEAELLALFDSVHDLEDMDFFTSNSFPALVRHLLKKGTLQDHRVLQERLKRLLGDLTFADAYQRSGRILNVVVTAADTEEPPRLLNYLTAPQVLVWSAVACSSAFPLLFEPQPLMARWVDGSTVEFMSALGSWAEGGAGAATTTATAGKVAGGEVTPSGSPGIGPPGAPWPSPKPAAHHRRWRDGSLEADLPMAGLSEMFNVNYFLVSQANPYLLPIIALKKATPRALGHLVESEFKHRCRQILELLPLGARRSSFARLLTLFNQPWEGDCTMVLPFQTLSAAKSVVNLSQTDLLRALREGQRAAWVKLPAIAVNCAVEATIDECLRGVMAGRASQGGRAGARQGMGPRWTVPGSQLGPRSRHASRVNLRRSLPSWLHMPTLGMSAADSEVWGSQPAHSPISEERPLLDDNLVTGLSAGSAEPIPIPRGPGSQDLSASLLEGHGQGQVTGALDDAVPEQGDGHLFDMDLAEEPGSPPHGRPLRKGSQVWTDLFLSSVASNSMDYPGP
uniref:PNPLA domain-containing protein n=2 Tax=Auxenochlorella protothecoides TaxID=3075 RepID=A0A1D2A9V5_AUXPR